MSNKPQYRQEWIFELLKLEGLGYTQMLRRYTVKFRNSKNTELSEETFKKDWKNAKESELDYYTKLNIKKESISINSEIKALKLGLDTKIETILYYQNACRIMDDQLNGKLEFTFKLGNSIKNSHNNGVFMLPIENQLDIRTKIDNYKSIIIKLQGFNAPTKSEVAITEKPIDLSRMPLEDLKTMQEILKKQNDTPQSPE